MVFGADKDQANDFKNLDKKLKILHHQFKESGEEYLANEASKVLDNLEKFNEREVPKGKAARKILKEEAEDIYQIYKRLTEIFEELNKETKSSSHVENLKKIGKDNSNVIG